MRPASTVADRGVTRPSEPGLFDLLPKPEADTREQAAVVAGSVAKRRRAEILRLLQEHGPQTLFELARWLQVPDHAISGRITDLKRECLIEPTGERRPNPRSGVRCEVYRCRPAGALADTKHHANKARAGGGP
jgi:hypothetical protein